MSFEVVKRSSTMSQNNMFRLMIVRLMQEIGKELMRTPNFMILFKIKIFVDFSSQKNHREIKMVENLIRINSKPSFSHDHSL